VLDSPLSWDCRVAGAFAGLRENKPEYAHVEGLGLGVGLAPMELLVELFVRGLERGLQPVAPASHLFSFFPSAALLQSGRLAWADWKGAHSADSAKGRVVAVNRSAQGLGLTPANRENRLSACSEASGCLEARRKDRAPQTECEEVGETA
jgi:hypothetical protein